MRCTADGCCLGALLLAFLTPYAPTAELPVGPGKTYARVEDALARAKPGDVILVHPQADNRAYEKVALSVNEPNLTIKAASASGIRIPLNGTGGDYSGRGPVPRAIVQFNKGADHGLLEGFELTGAHNESHNGAGVRINQANHVTIRACSIHNNDMGIMSNGDGTTGTAVNQVIEDCLIYRNGNAQEPGQSHNLYLGGTSVTLRGCEVHSSVAGHNVKSRAHHTRIFACYVHDSAHREFDLVDGKGDTTVSGSDAVLAGNIIVKGPGCSGNRSVIHFGQDGGEEHDGTLFLIHNTIVTPFISPVIHLSASKARVRLYNNIVWDGGTYQKGQVLVFAEKDTAKVPATGRCNWVSYGFMGADLYSLGLERTEVGRQGAVIAFTDVRKGDYRLAKADSQVVDGGCALPDDTIHAVDGGLLQHKAPQNSELRVATDMPDLGAVEWRAMRMAEPPSAGDGQKTAPEE